MDKRDDIEVKKTSRIDLFLIRVLALAGILFLLVAATVLVKRFITG